MGITIMNETEKIIEQAKLNQELKGLKKVKEKKDYTRCPYCKTEEVLIKLDAHGNRPWTTCQDTEGNRMEGLENEMGKCPKCNSFLGAIQTEFVGFFNDNGKISKKNAHIHCCDNCGWTSKTYEGTFVSRD